MPTYAAITVDVDIEAGFIRSLMASRRHYAAVRDIFHLPRTPRQQRMAGCWTAPPCAILSLSVSAATSRLLPPEKRRDALILAHTAMPRR